MWSVWGTEKGEWGRKSVGVAPTPPARPPRGVRPLPGARGVLGYRQDWQPLGSAPLPGAQASPVSASSYPGSGGGGRPPEGATRAKGQECDL